MKIYLVSSDYEGNADVAFSTQELAERYLIANGGDCVIAVTLDGDGYEMLKPSEMLKAHYSNLEAKRINEQAEFDEWLNTLTCQMCNLINRECQCWATVSCGELGGVTKKGTACLNEVLVRENQKCHNHR